MYLKNVIVEKIRLAESPSFKEIGHFLREREYSICQQYMESALSDQTIKACKQLTVEMAESLELQKEAAFNQMESVAVFIALAPAECAITMYSYTEGINKKTRESLLEISESLGDVGVFLKDRLTFFDRCSNLIKVYGKSSNLDGWMKGSRRIN